MKNKDILNSLTHAGFPDLSLSMLSLFRYYPLSS